MLGLFVYSPRLESCDRQKCNRNYCSCSVLVLLLVTEFSLMGGLGM